MEILVYCFRNCLAVCPAVIPCYFLTSVAEFWYFCIPRSTCYLLPFGNSCLNGCEIVFLMWFVLHFYTLPTLSVVECFLISKTLMCMAVLPACTPHTCNVYRQQGISPLELESQVVLSHPVGASFSGRAASAFNCCTISPVLKHGLCVCWPTTYLFGVTWIHA